MSSLKLLEVENIKKFDQNYTILQKIGQGAYGSVYKAKHNTSGTVVAVKSLHLHSQDVEELRKEIDFMKVLDSNSVVRYFGNFLQDTVMWIIMEYCQYGSCRDVILLRDAPFSEREVRAITRDVLLGLKYLHGIKKIHRDIKADNILLNEVGESKLADFGVSGTGEKWNTVIGTPFYLAPEVIVNDGFYDTKVDIWSLGISLIELAEKNPPFHDEQPMRILFKIPTNPPPTLFEPSKFSKEFNDFLAKCLIKDPEERKTADELLEHPFVTGVEPSSVIMKELLKEIEQIHAHDIELQLQEQEKEQEKEQVKEKENQEQVQSEVIVVTSTDDKEVQNKENIIEKEEVEEVIHASSQPRTDLWGSPVKSESDHLETTKKEHTEDFSPTSSSPTRTSTSKKLKSKSKSIVDQEKPDTVPTILVNDNKEEPKPEPDDKHKVQGHNRRRSVSLTESGSVSNDNQDQKSTDNDVSWGALVGNLNKGNFRVSKINFVESSDSNSSQSNSPMSTLTPISPPISTDESDKKKSKKKKKEKKEKEKEKEREKEKEKEREKEKAREKEKESEENEKKTKVSFANYKDEEQQPKNEVAPVQTKGPPRILSKLNRSNASFNLRGGSKLKSSLGESTDFGKTLEELMAEENREYENKLEQEVKKREKEAKEKNDVIAKKSKEHKQSILSKFFGKKQTKTELVSRSNEEEDKSSSGKSQHKSQSIFRPGHGRSRSKSNM